MLMNVNASKLCIFDEKCMLQRVKSVIIFCIVYNNYFLIIQLFSHFFEILFFRKKKKSFQFFHNFAYSSRLSITISVV